MPHDTSPAAATTIRPEHVAWPRGLQLFALVAFMTNLGAVLYLVY